MDHLLKRLVPAVAFSTIIPAIRHSCALSLIGDLNALRSAKSDAAIQRGDQGLGGLGFVERCLIDIAGRLRGS